MSPYSISPLKYWGKQHEKRQDHRQVAVRRSEKRQVPLPADEKTEISQDVAKTLSDMGDLRFLALIKGNRLGVVPHMDKRVTEIRLVPELIEVQADKTPSYQDSEDTPH